MELAYSQFVSDIKHFADAVNWEEPFIAGLLSFHIMLLFWIFVVRKNPVLLISSLLSSGVMVLLAETINGYASKYYRHFATQNYFDESGTFLVTVYSFPLVLNMLVALLFLLTHVWSSLVSAKQAQLKSKAQLKKKKKA